jgi:alpha-beta hydrolase superfamily lysophospholipase
LIRGERYDVKDDRWGREGRKEMPDYALLDDMDTLMFIFYPRKYSTPCPGDAFDLALLVDSQVPITCRFYGGKAHGPWILFFHGNGEVVSDYDAIAPLYHQEGLNLIVADYRGYGASRGSPTLTHLVQDSHVLLQGVREELDRRGWGNDLWIMGRSLGSISALELAYHHQDDLRGLILESGFPSVVSIIEHLGIPAEGVDLKTIHRECLERIEKLSLPSLIIHGEIDTLVPLSEARTIYEHLGSESKELLVIPSANHNNLLYVGPREYFNALGRFVERTDPSGRFKIRGNL